MDRQASRAGQAHRARAFRRSRDQRARGRARVQRRRGQHRSRRDARQRLKGDLRDFPFVDRTKGEFQVNVRVQKGAYEYVSGWPRVYDIDAELLFERDRMEILARSASILGAKAANVRVAIPAMLA